MSGWLSDKGWGGDLASPGPIGNVTPSTGAFTTLSATTSVTSPIVKANGSGGGVLQSSNGTQCMQWGGGGGANVTIDGGLSAAASVTLQAGTANGVLYLNGSKAATSGSGLVFDGSNFGLGVTPSGWGSGLKALQIGANSYASLFDFDNGVTFLSSNLFWTGAAYSRISASSRWSFAYSQDTTNGKHTWLTSTVAGTTTPTMNTLMTLDANSNLLVGTTTSPTGSQTTGNVVANGVVSTAGYTVATLPTGMPTGSRAYVTDALTPTALSAVTGGGAVVVPVFYNGSSWIVG